MAQESLIGHTQVLTGPGAEPFLVTGGQVFLTEGYKGAPLGLSIVVPAKAGPYTLSGTTGAGRSLSARRSTSTRHTAALTSRATRCPRCWTGSRWQLKVVNVTIRSARLHVQPDQLQQTGDRRDTRQHAGRGRGRVLFRSRSPTARRSAFKPRLRGVDLGQDLQSEGRRASTRRSPTPPARRAPRRTSLGQGRSPQSSSRHG